MQWQWWWGETVTGFADTVASDAVKVKLISDLSEDSFEDLLVTIHQKHVRGDQQKEEVCQGKGEEGGQSWRN